VAIEIRQEEQGDVRILILSGRLDTETSADLELALADLQAAGANRFVIDMGDIGYVSSAGLRVLLALAKQLETSRGSVRLCALNEAVKQVFDVAGFSKMFAIFRDRDAALGGAGVAPKPPAENALAKKAANLLGARDATPVANAESADLARAAAKLLGGEKPEAERRAKTPKPAPEPAKVKAPAEKSATASDQPGVLGKLRNLLGNKK